MKRTKLIFGHLAGQSVDTGNIQSRPTSGRRFSPSDDDVVIVQALRTPLCKATRGGLKDTLPDDMLAAAFNGVLKDTGIPGHMIQDIAVGNVNGPGCGLVVGRIAQFFCGMPETVPMTGVNRACSSGLQACASIASSIKAGNIDIGIGSGYETMTLNPLGGGPKSTFVPNPKLMENQKARDTLIPMGITSENVAERFGVSRESQDRFAYESHAKATRAQKNGWFDAEIIPVKTTVTGKDGAETEVLLTKDDGIRSSTTLEGLAKLKPVFKQGGSTTAGNSSQLTDGAAAVIMARRSFAKQHNLPILGVFHNFQVVGVPPDVMGIGPAYAIPAVLNKTGLTKDDIEIFEINEAFASQATYCVEKLGLPREKVNPKGGAIALGHPLGCTGARQVATLLHELKRRGKPAYGIVSMCMGSGMGAAALIEYPGH